MKTVCRAAAAGTVLAGLLMLSVPMVSVPVAAQISPPVAPKAAPPVAAVTPPVAAQAAPPVAAAAAPAGTQAAAPACTAPPGAGKFVKPLVRLARRAERGEPIIIVAIGSSSTAGTGASSGTMSYPSRLEAELKQRFAGVAIKVINRGINGEEAPEMLKRLDGVIAEKPDLVLWQIGTNAVLRDRSVEAQGPVIQEGIARLKAAGADVILIDLQFAPKVIAKADAERMVAVISTAAKQGDVDLFQRFAVMRHWRDDDLIPFEKFLSPDLLHLNDWSYGCIAKLLAADITEAVTRAPMTAHGILTR